MGLHHEDLTREIIGAAIEVHRRLGPGLLESAYRRCLVHELRLRDVSVASEVPIDLEYRGLVVPASYRVDLLVADRVVVELKAVETVSPIHEAQLLTYLRLANRKTGLLLNFNVKRLTEGIIRRVL
jgi:GxxExxY protein